MWATFYQSTAPLCQKLYLVGAYVPFCSNFHSGRKFKHLLVTTMDTKRFFYSRPE